MLSLFLAVPPWMMATEIQLDLSGVMNKDVIYENGGSASKFGENPGADQSFAADGYTNGVDTAFGLPANQLLGSSQSELGNYRLAPYNGSNVLELYSHNTLPMTNFVVDVPDDRYRQFGLLVAAVDGDVSFTIKLNYADGSVSTNWWEADDWHDAGIDLRPSQNVIISGMDRVNVSSGTIETSAHFSLFEFLVPADTNLTLLSITLGTDPNRWPDDQDRWGGVFAMNGVFAVPDPSTLHLVLLGIPGLLWSLRKSRTNQTFS